LVALCAGGTLVGCSTRTITVTSNPEGAAVWLNDRAVGRTPVTVDFVYFGVYDVRVELQGYRPVHGPREAPAPWWEWPALDALAAAVPFDKRTELVWHYELEADPAEDPLLVNRAWATRWMSEELPLPPAAPTGGAPVPEADEPSGSVEDGAGGDAGDG
jgi:hypothetical protein